MIYTSLESSPIVYHQKKINIIINKFLNSLSPNFKTSNPILSGSFLIKLLVRPEAEFTDYDFYFANSDDFTLAKEILDNISLESSESKNCISYYLPEIDQQVQIIKSYNLPKQIISSHDFSNSMAAWQNNNIYFHKEFFVSWKENYLCIKNKQFSFDENDNYIIDNKWLAKYTILLSRVNKYLKRYNLTLHDETKNTLLELYNLLRSNKEKFKNFDFSLINSTKIKNFDYSLINSSLKISSIDNLLSTTLIIIEERNNETCLSQP